MSMTIPQMVWDKYKEGADKMIDCWFGKPCTLFYPKIKTVCPNCNFNPVTVRSSNTYKIGGPIFFDNGICPYCNGDGYTDYESSETIKMRCYFNSKDWVKVEIPVNIRSGAVQTIGHITDIPKCLKSTRVKMVSDQNYLNLDFVLAGEPQLHGLKKDSYFIAFWNRV